MDTELAELAEEAEIGAEPDRDPAVLPVSEATQEVQLLVRLVQLNQALLQSKQPKRINFPPLPQVRTARAEVRKNRRERHRGRLLQMVAEAQARWAAAHPDE